MVSFGVVELKLSLSIRQGIYSELSTRHDTFGDAKELRTMAE